MKLGMSQSFGLEPKQKARMEQKISLSEQLVLRQSLIHEMGYHVVNIRDGGPDAPDKLFQSVLDEILNSIEDETLRNGLKAVFADETFRKKVLDSVELLAVPTKTRTQEVVLRYLYDMHHGEFP